tara:strand:+ start:9645 stop:10232 length:588 start_codon:yes stop_codon:yes gene_type:complete
MINLMIGLSAFFSLAAIAITAWLMLFSSRKKTSPKSSGLPIESKKSVSKMPMYRYDQCVSANVSIDGVKLDWSIVSYASVSRRHVFVEGDVGQFIELGKKTKLIAVGQGFMLFGNVVITNIVMAEELSKPEIFKRNRGHVYFSRDDAEQLCDLLSVINEIDLSDSGEHVDYDRVLIIRDQLAAEYKIPQDCGAAS